MKEEIYLVRCNRCGKKQQTVRRGRFPTGSKECVGCGKNFTLNPKTIIGKVHK